MASAPRSPSSCTVCRAGSTTELGCRSRRDRRSQAEALDLCLWLANYNVGWVEDFIHPERFGEYAWVRARSPVPIAAGEHVATIWDFERLIGRGCVDIVQPDLTHCGGITVARRVAQLAEAANIDFVPHSWLTHLLTGYSLQLIATLPRALGGIQRRPEPADAGHRARVLRARGGRDGRDSGHARRGRGGRPGLRTGTSRGLMHDVASGAAGVVRSSA